MVRVSRNIKPMLASCAKRHMGWGAYLCRIAFALRTTVSCSIGFTPAFLTFGRELKYPMTNVLGQQNRVTAANTIVDYAGRLKTRTEATFRQARQNLSKARASEPELRYDSSLQAVHYIVGDLVLRRHHILSDASKGFAASLASRWPGPYQVTAKLSELMYQLADPQSRKAIGPLHVSNIKSHTLWVGGDTSVASSGTADMQMKTLHEVAEENSCLPRYSLCPRRTRVRPPGSKHCRLDLLTSRT